MSQQPVPGTRSAVRNLERAAPGSPIWPCTRWGFPCLRACAWSGGLLPHLFTLTPPSLPRPWRSKFLWHFPSGRLTAPPPACISPPAFLRRPGQLRGIAPFGVRTFLLPRIAPGKAILRPSKITANIPGWWRQDKLHILWLRLLPPRALGWLLSDCRSRRNYSLGRPVPPHPGPLPRGEGDHQRRWK